MLGAAGCLVPELLTNAGVADLPTWSEAGHAEYFTDAVTLGLVQAILFNWVEVLRFQDMRKPGSVHEGAWFPRAAPRDSHRRVLTFPRRARPLLRPDLQGQQVHRHRARLPRRRPV
jgi:hypothetical protein